MTKILVDGTEVDVPADYTLLQACEAAGAEIPRFCFHERLSIAGNCRMCLVELKGAPKPVASCAYAVKDCRPGPNGEPPEVLTRSQGTKKAREGVMEFLLINHPLDCPICDQGGHCDLQDQAMAYGVDSTRYTENKRAVEEKHIGPLVRTAMNRCIHCTRCVRFLAEVAGVPDLGAIGRGEDMEITSYLEQSMASELQGNVADLCPVGALVHRPQSYNVRPWELNKTESVDVMDAVGSSIRIDTRGREVMQIEPRISEEINEEWISDKTRYHIDGLRMQRLDRPYLRENGRLRPASWGEAFQAIAAKVKGTDPKRVGAVVGDLAGVEEIFALRELVRSLGSPNLDCRQTDAGLDPALGRASYIFNPTIPGIEAADAILIVGANPRTEASLLNVRIRKRWRMAPLAVGVIGEPVDLTYPSHYIGAGPDSLAALARGEHSFLEILKEAKAPLVIVGADAAPGILAAAASLAKEIGAVSAEGNGFGVLHTAAARVGALDLGFVPGEGGLTFAQMLEPGALDVLFNLGADERDVAPGAFVVYQGSHGDRGAARADVILPGAAYSEKSATWVNTEGRVQMGNRAAFPPGDAREDWAILRALSDVLGKRLPFDSLTALRRALYAAHPHLAAVGAVEPGNVTEAVDRLAGLGGTATGPAFASPVTDFYLTNPIARASRILAECSRLARERAAEARPLAAAE
ncbi:NADH-quinone oxidoreductase subunit G [Methylobacterium sp. UNC300MFChir4.1]|uniref:NADH-quinone oxidoreductase subunit NuoG n=1 Tax=Methylobacterium sp. UNC300MFChir4.1 TaxID=1502747 RepID=UPI0008CCA612|nr:NADH-quinone oxidoreductase subunit NuoG [Methylobacterium sp. UNC300MFChir4.1]SEO48704.1 NADH-quinone oxidoreductase subunit G [Methylobacterium sp. UNC300MFChir4.1]